jgi:hypothetical protein
MDTWHHNVLPGLPLDNDHDGDSNLGSIGSLMDGIIDPYPESVDPTADETWY